MLKRTTILSGALLLCTSALAQLSATFAGQVIDAATGEPIPFVHIVGSNVQAISDYDGFFSLVIEEGDSLVFSHVNFEPYRMYISQLSKSTIAIRLKRKETLMQEIIIRDYLPEAELKQKMIEHEVIYTIEEINAVNNVAYSTILYKKGYIPEMNSLDNFKNYMKEPQGVTLFSTNPSKGIIKTIQRLRSKHNSYPEHDLKPIKLDTAYINLFPVSPE